MYDGIFHKRTVFRMIGKVIRASNVGASSATCMARVRRTSTPIRTWSPGSAIRPTWSRIPSPEPGTSAGSRAVGAALGRPRRIRLPRPVWHCAMRAAPEDRMLPDEEWAQVAARVMHRTGLAPYGDDLGVRWVAVRHAPDHIHIVATRPARTATGRRYGTTSTGSGTPAGTRNVCSGYVPLLRQIAPPPVGHPGRDGTVDPAWLGRAAPRHAAPRGIHGRCRIRHGAGVLRPAGPVRNPGPQAVQHCPPGEVTGYAVGLRDHTASDGGLSGTAAGSSPPISRCRNSAPAGLVPQAGGDPFTGRVFPRRRSQRATATRRPCGGPRTDEAGSSAPCGRPGCWCGCGSARPIPGGHRLFRRTPRPHRPGREHRCGTAAADWPPGSRCPGCGNAGSEGFAWVGGTFRNVTVKPPPERDEIYRHAARQAATAAEHLRHCTATDPDQGADTAWAVADALHAAAHGDREPGIALCRGHLRPGLPLTARQNPAPNPGGEPASGRGAAARDDRAARLATA